MIKKLLFTSLAIIATCMSVNAQVFSEDFENGANNWTFVDNDGDGNNWFPAELNGLPEFGTTGLVSQSYNGSALSPDNLVTSPAIDLTSFSGSNLILSYQYTTVASFPNEKYSIYITTSNDAGDITSSTPVYTETVQNGNITKRFVDVSEFIDEDNVYLTFRHYDCTNQYYIILDNIELAEFNERDINLSISTDKGVLPGDQTIAGSFYNNGIENVNSLELNWQVDDGETYTQTFNGLNLPLGSTGSYTFTDLWNAQTSGDYEVRVWASQINGTSVENMEVTKDISVASGSTDMTPLLERFTSATCIPCAAFNEGFFNEFHEQREDEYLYIAYQLNFPGDGDDYYIEDAGLRANYYGVNSIPSLRIQGTPAETNVFQNGTANSNVGELLDGILDKEAVFEITNANAELDGQTATLDIAITPYVSGEYTIRAVVIEHETTGNLGSNGEDKFINVMMHMFDGEEGSVVNFTQGTSYEESFTADLSNTFIEDFNDLDVIVLIQNDETKEIKQAAKASGSLDVKKIVSNKLTLHPNPATEGFVNIFTDDEAFVKIYDVTGKLVKVKTPLQVGNNTLDVNGLSQGIYLAKITSRNTTTTKKLIIE